AIFTTNTVRANPEGLALIDQSRLIELVEARGVEPLSGRKATKVSPSAADIFVSLTGRLSAGFPQLSLLVFPTVSPGIKRRPVSLLCDARYWSAGQTRRTGCLI